MPQPNGQPKIDPNFVPKKKVFPRPNPLDDDMKTWMPDAQKATEAWNTCPRGDWLICALYMQTEQVSERRRVTGLLYGIFSPFLSDDHLPDSDIRAQVTNIGTKIQSFSAGGDGAADSKELAELASILLSTTKYDAAKKIQFYVVTAIGALAQCASWDKNSARDTALTFATMLMSLHVELGVGGYTANEAGWTNLANDVRTAVSFRYFNE